MPQTLEEWRYLGDLYEKGYLALEAENGKLRAKINTLEQKLANANNHCKIHQR